MQEHFDAGLDAHWTETLAAATGLARPPFSAAVRASGTTVYTAGQTFPAIGSGDTRAASAVSMAEQTAACLANIDRILLAAGATRNDVVKVTIFNTDMAAQGEVNRVYLEYFGDHRPARSHIGVTRLADPDLLIEIEAIAVL